MQPAVHPIFLALFCGALSCFHTGCRKGGEVVVTQPESNATAENRRDVAEIDNSDVAGSNGTEDAESDSPRRGGVSLPEPNEFAVASYNDGIMSLQQGSYNDAIEKFSLAIELAPLFAQAFNNRGIAHAKIESYDRAIDDFKDAIIIDLQLSDAYKNAGAAGAMALNGNQYKEAIRLCQLALEKHRSGKASGAFDETWIPKTYNNLGIAFLMDKQQKLAVESFQTALRLDPAFADAERNLNMARGVENALTVSSVDPKELCIAHMLYSFVLSMTDLSESKRDEISFEESSAFYGIPQNEVARIFREHASRHYPEATELMLTEAAALKSISSDTPSFKSVVELLR